MTESLIAYPVEGKAVSDDSERCSALGTGRLP